MVPPNSGSFLQSPEPLHFSASRKIPNDDEKSKTVSISGSFLSISYLKDVSMENGSTIFPGLKILSGSKAVLIRFKISLYYFGFY